MVWKDNKHGIDENDLHCFSCQFFQPWDQTQPPPRPQPNGGNGEVLEEEEEPLEAARIDPVEPTEEATYEGFCRAKHVPITNLNMAVLYDAKAGYFKTDYQNSDHELLNEPQIVMSPEFWCRKWKRALYPFIWPPIASS